MRPSALGKKQLRLQFLKLLYRVRKIRGIARLPFGRRFHAVSSRVLGLECYGYDEGWETLGIGFMPLPHTPYWMGLNLAVWSQRISFFEGRYYETPETNFLLRELEKGGVFIDVGVNVGFHTVLASFVVGQKGRCIGFEPDWTNFRIARAHVDLNRIQNVSLHQLGLYDIAGMASLASTHTEDYGASLRPVSQGAGDQLDVPLVRGDDLLDDIAPDAKGVCKIDVEGAEMKVLRGMEKFIENHPGFVYLVELTPRWLRDTGDSAGAMVDFFEKFGLVPHRLGRNGVTKPFTGDLRNVTQMNVVFARSDPDHINPAA